MKAAALEARNLGRNARRDFPSLVERTTNLGIGGIQRQRDHHGDTESAEKDFCGQRAILVSVVNLV
jgi:hypothetical protein